MCAAAGKFKRIIAGAWELIYCLGPRVSEDTRGLLPGLLLQNVNRNTHKLRAPIVCVNIQIRYTVHTTGAWSHDVCTYTDHTYLYIKLNYTATTPTRACEMANK